ncbi:MAG: DUF1080 domain-containing protein [Planctomycetota bacterium]
MIRVATIFSTLFLLSSPSSDRANAQDWRSLIADGMEGWTKVGGEATYSFADGVITGRTGPGKNTFLTTGPFADFELEFEVKCDPGLNSGVQIRSHLYPQKTPQESNPKRIREKGEMNGYQCEIRADVNGEHGCAGNFWDEARRTKWLDETVKAEEKQSAYKPGEWNKMRIVAKGDRIQSFVNGIDVADFKDDRDSEGIIGLQVHAIKKGKGPFEVSWRNIRIREIK